MNKEKVIKTNSFPKQGMPFCRIVSKYPNLFVTLFDELRMLYAI